MEELKEDDSALAVIIEKINMISTEDSITTSELKDALQNTIEELKNDSTYYTNDETITITVYASDGKLVRTELKTGSDVIYIDTQANEKSERMLISFGNVDSNIQDEDIIDSDSEMTQIIDYANTLKKLEIVKNNGIDNNHIILIASFEGNVEISAQIKNTVGEVLQNNSEINVNINNETYFTIKANTVKTPSSDIEIEKLTKQNSATINDFTPQYMSNLAEQIISRLQSLYTQKMLLISTIVPQSNETDGIYLEEQHTQEVYTQGNNTVNTTYNNQII